MSEPQVFAFGSNHVGSCECPMVAAGLPPSDEYRRTVARKFDKQVHQLLDTCRDTGTVSEEITKQAWNNIIDDLAECQYRRQHSIAKRTAEELGWLDNE